MPRRRQGRGKKPRLWVSELSCRRLDRNAGGLPGGRAALSSRSPPRGRCSFPGAEAWWWGGAGKRPGQRRGFHRPPQPAAARGATAPPTRPRPPSHSRLPTADVRGSHPFALTRGLFKDVKRKNVIRSGSWKDQPALRRGRGRGWPERPPVPSFRRVRLCMVTYQT